MRNWDAIMLTSADGQYEDLRPPVVRVYTTDNIPIEATQEILLFLGSKGLI